LLLACCVAVVAILFLVCWLALLVFALGRKFVASFFGMAHFALFFLLCHFWFAPVALLSPYLLLLCRYSIALVALPVFMSSFWCFFGLPLPSPLKVFLCP
jgi:hypothetical protein